jgi:hypothetical protein
MVKHIVIRKDTEELLIQAREVAIQNISKVDKLFNKDRRISNNEVINRALRYYIEA